MASYPEEVLFSPTASCNLRCPHCNSKSSKTTLPVKAAKKFLIDCKKIGIKRIGFTGGEPFLACSFLYSITRFAVKEGLIFTRIMTNGVWFKNDIYLKEALGKLFDAGYDGSLTVSVDAYHKQDLKKVARFIETALSIWRRPDLISIVYVTGRNAATKEKLSELAGLLKGMLSGFGGSYAHIKSIGNCSSRAGFPAEAGSRKRRENLPYHIKIAKIDLSPVGRARHLKDPWDGKWFKEDLCEGPGNLFFVEPSGAVKPCCGYASESDALYIGNIRKDSPPRMIKYIRQNRLLYAIFNSGLSRIKSKIVKYGVKFPGKTSNNCFFCHYILTKVPRGLLLASLEG